MIQAITIHVMYVYTPSPQLLPGKSGDAWIIYLNKATTELALGRTAACLADLDEARLLHGQPDVLLFANKALALERLGKYPQVGVWGREGEGMEGGAALIP